MSDWKSPIVEKPPQGTKILWWDKGDCYVAQRFGEKYLTYTPEKSSILGIPKLWKYIEFPSPYDGKMMVKIDGHVIKNLLIK